MVESPPELEAEVAELKRKHEENEDRYFVPLANAYRKLGEFDEAELVLREGLARHPDQLSGHIVLGRCLAERGAFTEAAAEFRGVLEADPQNLIALRMLAEIAAAQGRSQEAVSWYDQLLTADPENEEALEAVRILQRSSRRPQWLADERVSPIPVEHDYAEDAVGDEDDELLSETLADLYVRQGHHDRAAGVYRELIRRGRDTPACHERLAEIERVAAPAAESAEHVGDPAAASAGSAQSIREYLQTLCAWQPRGSRDLTEVSPEYADQRPSQRGWSA